MVVFPLSSADYEGIWFRAITQNKTHQEALEATKNSRPSHVPRILPQLNFPSQPATPPTVMAHVESVQLALNSFQYNYTGTDFVRLDKKLPLHRMRRECKHMLRFPLPIKCLEATVLAAYLSSPQLRRVPISFDSKCGPRVYRHVVLGVCHGGVWGALGLSRRDQLMYKPMAHESLGELVADFAKSYGQCRHRVTRIIIGGNVPADWDSFSRFPWRSFHLHPQRQPQAEIDRSLRQIARSLRSDKPGTC